MVGLASICCMISFRFSGIITFFLPLPGTLCTEFIFLNVSIKHFIVLLGILPDPGRSFLNSSFTFVYDLWHNKLWQRIVAVLQKKSFSLGITTHNTFVQNIYRPTHRLGVYKPSVYRWETQAIYIFWCYEGLAESNASTPLNPVIMVVSKWNRSQKKE